MSLSKKTVVNLGRVGLLRYAELKSDMSLTLETGIPGFFGTWTKHTITPKDEPYKLLLFLSDLKKPGDVLHMFDLTKNESSRLYVIPKDLYEEEEEKPQS